MPTVFITGASRGLGLGFVQHYLAAGWQVHAAARTVDKGDLAALAAKHASLKLYPLDVTDHQAIESLAGALAGVQLDLLINNAGIYGPKDAQDFGKIDYDNWRAVIEVNTFAPVKIAEVLAGHISQGGKLIMITSRVGSIADASSGSYAYRTSKTALNMVTKLLAADLGARGISVAALHPGWVQTDMGGDHALISVDESITGLTQVIEKLSLNDNGCFKNYKGEPLPW